MAAGVQGLEVGQGSEHDPGTAQLERWMVGALSPYSPAGVEVPLAPTSRWSPYPSVQTCDWGILGSSKGAPVALHSLGPELALDITVLADGGSMVNCQGDAESQSALSLYRT